MANIALITNNILSDSGTAITSVLSGSGTTNYLSKFTGSTALGNSIIYDDGTAVGIGTTSPYGKLSLEADGTVNNYSSVIRVANTGSGKWGGISFVDSQTSTTNANNYYFIGRGASFSDRVLSLHIPTASDYGSGSQPKIGFYSTGADTLFTVEASTGTSYFKGNVGIGTTSPTQKLQIGDGAGTGNQYVRVYSSSADIYIGQSVGGLFGLPANQAGNIASDNVNYPFAIGTVSSQPLIFGTVNAERMRITANGNIGVGTTTPFDSLSYKTETFDGSVGSFTEYRENGTAYFRVGADGSRPFLYSITGAPIDFYISGTVAQRIASSGNVLIGTTTDAGYKLDVNGTGRVQTSFTIGGASDGTLYFPNTTSGHQIRIYSQFASNALVLYANGYNLQLNGAGGMTTNLCTTITGSNGSTALVVQQGNAAWTPVAKFNAIGSTGTQFNTNGNVLIGTTTDAGQKLQIAGNQAITYASTGESLTISRTGTYVSTPLSSLVTITDTTSNANQAKTGLYVNVANASTNIAIQTVGSVGVGATPPQNSFSFVSGYFSYLLAGATANSAANYNINARSIISSYAAGNGGGISFWGDDRGQAGANTAFAGIRGVKENSTYVNGLGALTFLTQASTSGLSTESTFAEVGRFTSGGNFLIGTTTNSTYKLDVLGTIRANNTAYGQSTVRIETNNAADMCTQIVFMQNSPNWPSYIGTHVSGGGANYGLQFKSQNAINLVMNRDGSNFFGNALVMGSARVHIRGAGSTSSTTPFLVENSSVTELFRVWDDGNVGIGVGGVNAGYKLNVNGNGNFILGNSGYIRLQSGSGQRHGYIQSAYSNFLFSNNIYFDGSNWRYDQNGYGAQIQTETLSSGVIAFNTFASGTGGSIATIIESMRIVNNGNILMGDTNDLGFKLQVTGKSIFSDTIIQDYGNNSSALSGITSYITQSTLDSNYTNGSYSGETISGQLASTVIAGQVVAMRASTLQWELADASTAASIGKNMIGIACYGGNNGDTITILLRGFFASDTYYNNSGNYGVPMYLNAGTSGSLTDVAPSTTGNIVRIVGHIDNYSNSNSCAVLRFNPDNSWLVI